MYDKLSFLKGLALGLAGKPLEFAKGEPEIVTGDYTGTAPALGYAWCLGKAVPVYDKPGLVDNPQYARYYVSELPSFSRKDYSYTTDTLQYAVLRFTEADYLSIMGMCTFETVGDFPFLSLFLRTDRSGFRLYGYNWIRASDDRAYAISEICSNALAEPGSVQYFDIYLTGDTGSTTGLYKEILGFGVRLEGGEFENYGTVDSPIKADRAGNYLTTKNVGDYLVLTQTHNRSKGGITDLAKSMVVDELTESGQAGYAEPGKVYTYDGNIENAEGFIIVDEIIYAQIATGEFDLSKVTRADLIYSDQSVTLNSADMQATMDEDGTQKLTATVDGITLPGVICQDGKLFVFSMGENNYVKTVEFAETIHPIDQASFLQGWLVGRRLAGMRKLPDAPPVDPPEGTNARIVDDVLVVTGRGTATIIDGVLYVK